MMQERSMVDVEPGAAPTDELVMVRGDVAMRVFIHLLLNFLHRTDRERRAFYNPGVLQASAHRREAFERGMRDTLQFINDCLKLGLLQLAPRTGRQAQPAKLKQ
jgi:hypothetical protein